MFIWDFVADKILGQIVDWFYGQVVGFLGNFFAEMGNMGAELFTMDWVQSIVLFFSYLAWALYGTGLVVACFETGVEYSSGRGNIRETALNAIKGFMAVSLFTVVPVRLYELCVSLQGTFTAALTGYGTSIGDVAGEVMQEFNAVESISDLTAGPLLGHEGLIKTINRRKSTAYLELDLCGRRVTTRVGLAVLTNEQRAIRSLKRAIA